MADRVIQAKTRVFAPPTIDEIAPAVSLRGPDQPRKRLHNTAEIDLHTRTFVTAHCHHARSAQQNNDDIFGLEVLE